MLIVKAFLLYYNLAICLNKINNEVTRQFSSQDGDGLHGQSQRWTLLQRFSPETLLRQEGAWICLLWQHIFLQVSLESFSPEYSPEKVKQAPATPEIDVQRAINSKIGQETINNDIKKDGKSNAANDKLRGKNINNQ